MTAGVAARLGVVLGFLASVSYVHARGRVRLRLRRQITDHSTVFAPFNALICLFSRVPRQALLDVGLLPQLAVLREHWREIADEARRLYDAEHIRASDRHDDVGFETFFRKGWKRFYVKWYGQPLPSARAHCPRTVELVQSIPSVHGAMFALLEPGSRIGEHRDPFAGSLRYHLGLITPNRDECCIHVDGERRSWRDGEDLPFDETYVHRFENRTDQPRIILFCDVERPLWTPVMRALNRLVIRFVVPLTATKNVDGEPVGLANHVFRHVYRVRAWRGHLKRRSQTLYYALKYALLAALIGGLLLWW